MSRDGTKAEDTNQRLGSSEPCAIEPSATGVAGLAESLNPEELAVLREFFAILDRWEKRASHVKGEKEGKNG